MARRSKADALLTRQLILEAAERVFLVNTVSGSSLDMIAKEAGLTRGAIYWHFRDKANLLVAVTESAIASWQTSLRHLLTSHSEDPEANLARLALHPLEMLQSSAGERLRFRISIDLIESRNAPLPLIEQHTQCIQSYLQGITVEFERGRNMGMWPQSFPARMAAFGLFSMVDGLMRKGTEPNAEINLVDVGRLAIPAFLRGL